MWTFRRANASPMTYRRIIRDGLAVAGLLFAGYVFVIEAPSTGTVGYDAFAYWAVDLMHPYTHVAGELGAFTYTPVAARAFAPAALLDWTSFWWLWMAAQVATVVWLGRAGWGRWSAGLLILAFPPVAVELYHGNIHLLMAAGIALGLRYPWTWAFLLLTKVTPGVGVLWFLVRREWRSLGIALGVTGALVVLSLIVDGRLWHEWIDDALVPAANGPLQQFYLAVPLAVRLPIAAAIIVWGARSDRTWVLPVGAVIALPVLWVSGFSILMAIPAIGRLRPANPRRLQAGDGTSTVWSSGGTPSSRNNSTIFDRNTDGEKVNA